MKEKFLKFSFCLPVYNEEKRIKRCLDSIKMQDYPQDKIEVLLVDGGSQDRTIQIASKYEFVKIFPNPERLADFGAKIAAKEATGDLFVAFAADNELVSENWLLMVAEVFDRRKDISSLWGKIVADKEDPSVNKYHELIQSDPLTFFINRNLKKYLKIGKRFTIDDKIGYIFSVDPHHSLVWGANGLVYKTEFIRHIISKEEFVGDNDVFQYMIEEGHNKVAYIPTLYTTHHHLDSLPHWMEKWKRNYGVHFLKYRKDRNMRWVIDDKFYFKLIMWIIYAGFPLFSLFHSLFLALKDRNKYWFYHPLASFLQLYTYVCLMIKSSEGKSLIREFLKL